MYPEAVLLLIGFECDWTNDSGTLFGFSRLSVEPVSTNKRIILSFFVRIIYGRFLSRQLRENFQ